MNKSGIVGICWGCGKYIDLNIFYLCEKCWEEHQPYGKAWQKRRKQNEKTGRVVGRNKKDG